MDEWWSSALPDIDSPCLYGWNTHNIVASRAEMMAQAVTVDFDLRKFRRERAKRLKQEFQDRRREEKERKSIQGQRNLLLSTEDKDAYRFTVNSFSEDASTPMRSSDPTQATNIPLIDGRPFSLPREWYAPGSWPIFHPGAETKGTADEHVERLISRLRLSQVGGPGPPTEASPEDSKVHIHVWDVDYVTRRRQTAYQTWDVESRVNYLATKFKDSWRRFSTRADIVHGNESDNEDDVDNDGDPFNGTAYDDDGNVIAKRNKRKRGVEYDLDGADAARAQHDRLDAMEFGLSRGGDEYGGRSSSSSPSSHHHWYNRKPGVIDHNTLTIGSNGLPERSRHQVLEPRPYAKQSDLVPVIRIYGTVDDGAGAPETDVILYVHNFEPYMYCELPMSWYPVEWTDCDVEEFITFSNFAFRQRWEKGVDRVLQSLSLSSETVRLCLGYAAPQLPRLNNSGVLEREFQSALTRQIESRYPDANLPINPILDVQVVAAASLWPFMHNKYTLFLRITTATPEVVVKARSVLTGEAAYWPHSDTEWERLRREHGHDGARTHAEKRNESEQFKFHGGHIKLKTYDCNVTFNLRAMVDIGLVGNSWITLDRSKFTVRTDREKETLFPLELDTTFENIVTHVPEERWARVPVRRNLSIDIECKGRKGHFPDPAIDPIIDICGTWFKSDATVKQILSRKANERGGKVMCFCMYTKETDPVDGALNFAFATEADMLEAFADLMRKVGANVLTGYNIEHFDLHYILRRIEVLGLARAVFWGRVLTPATWRTQFYRSKAVGGQERRQTKVDGLLVQDMMRIVIADYKRKSYTLNSVSADVLDVTKDDVHHSLISVLYDGDKTRKATPQTRGRLARYCLRDSQLPAGLMIKLLTETNDIELARVTGLTRKMIRVRGQGIRTQSKLLRYARELYMLKPYQTQNRRNEEEIQFEGALVREPWCGLYRRTIPTLDYEALYPSIMQRYNLCFTSVLENGEEKKLPPSDYFYVSYVTSDEEAVIEGVDVAEFAKRNPGRDLYSTGGFFVHPHVRKGILPTLLEDVLAARKKAKKSRDAVKDSDFLMYCILEGRQLALKIVANSTYGYTGGFDVRDARISAAVTSIGRWLIGRTGKWVEEKYNRANGYECDAKCIYGDTDSVMIDFGNVPRKRAIELGADAAEYVNSKLKPPLKIVYEKAMDPCLLMKKKRYSYVQYEKDADKPCVPDPHYPDRLVRYKGIEKIRRDQVPYLGFMQEHALHLILVENDVNGAVEFVKAQTRKLLAGEVSMSELIMSQTLSKEDYATKGPHVALAEKMMARDPGTAPLLGDRVPYVFVPAAPKSNLRDHVENPSYALKHDIPIDFAYTFEHKIRKPMVSLFLHVLKGDIETNGFSDPKVADKQLKLARKRVDSILFGDIVSGKMRVKSSSIGWGPMDRFIHASKTGDDFKKIQDVANRIPLSTQWETHITRAEKTWTELHESLCRRDTGMSLSAACALIIDCAQEMEDSNSELYAAIGSKRQQSRRMGMICLTNVCNSYQRRDMMYKHTLAAFTQRLKQIWSNRDSEIAATLASKKTERAQNTKKRRIERDEERVKVRKTLDDTIRIHSESSASGSATVTASELSVLQFEVGKKEKELKVPASWNPILSQSRCCVCRGIVKGEGALCIDCLPQATEVYLQTMEEMKESQRVVHAMWSQCQRCVESLGCSGDLIDCSQSECVIFHRRDEKDRAWKESRARLQALERQKWMRPDAW